MEPDDVDTRALLEGVLAVIRPTISSLKLLEEALYDEIDALPRPTSTSGLQLVKLARAREEDGDDAC